MDDVILPQLGDEVRCTVTGFRGIATQKKFQMNGNIQFAIQPPVREEEPPSLPDALWFDYHLLEVVTAQKVKAIPCVEEGHPAGTMVEDIFSGFRGRVESHTIYLNGCKAYSVIPAHRKDALWNDVPTGHSINADRLKVVEAKTPDVPVPAAKPIAERPTGGPITKVSRQVVKRA